MTDGGGSPDDPPTGDADEDVYQTYFDLRETPPSLALVRAVGAVDETDPRELKPLHDSIDTTALDNLLRSAVRKRDGDVHVVLEYHGHQVVVHSYGVIEVSLS